MMTIDGADTASSRRQEVGGPSGWSWRTDRRSHPGKFSGFLDISTGQALGDWGIWREHTGLRWSLDSSSQCACLSFRIPGQQPPPEPWPHPEPAWLPRLQPTTTVTGVGAVSPASMAPTVVQAAAAPELGSQPPPETGAQLGRGGGVLGGGTVMISLRGVHGGGRARRGGGGRAPAPRPPPPGPPLGGPRHCCWLFPQDIAAGGQVDWGNK